MGDCQHLEYPSLAKRDYKVSGNRDELLIGHALQFPTGQSRLPRLWDLKLHHCPARTCLDHVSM
jgi:hypothetical protein